MKAIIVGLVLSFYCTYSFAQIEEVQLLDSMKSQACNGNKACESMFISAISMASNIAREGANKQVISSQADSLIKISRIWADFFPAN
ncbi:hypothetical protein, partial [Klebsiella quasipneumoniae]|uniref:hypothetical protein n=1 Tax=Klebsiella quasipneumoniae TaxID=1463165 RepID=UPI0015F2C34C